MKRNQLFKIILTSVLIALNVILERFVPSIQVWNNNLNFGFIAVAFAACYLGVPYAVMVGGLGDFIGALIKPFGPYFVGYTITNMLVGLCFGLFLYQKATVLKISIAVLINKITCTLILNTIFIWALYRGGMDAIKAFSFSADGIAAFWNKFWPAFSPLFITRIPTTIFITVVEILLISLLFTSKSKINHLIQKQLPK